MILSLYEERVAIHAAEIEKLKGVIRGLITVCEVTFDNADACDPRETGWYQIAKEILK